MAELERKAGYGLVIGLSITAMIGTGVFLGPSIAATYAGNASIISWAILAVVGIYVGFCFAELASLFPGVGGVYEYAKNAYGRFTSFLFGWITWLVGSITSALLIVAGLNYLLPPDPVAKFVLAIAILVILTLVALKGVEASTALLLFFAIITLLVIIAVMVPALFHFNPNNFTPFFTQDKPPIYIFIALFFIFESFIGWESATFMGGETRNPEKIIPRSIIITSLLVGAIVFIFPVALLGYIPSHILTSFTTPLSDISYLLFGATGASLANIAIFLALIGSAAGGIVATPRLLMALAKDKLFIEQLASIHPKLKTPHKAILFQTVVSIIVIIAAMGDYTSLLSMLVPLVLLMYIGVIIAVPIFRKRFPDAKRTVKAPMGRFLPIIVALFYLGIIIAWLIVEPGALPLFRKVLSFVLFGFPIYILLNLYYNPDTLTKTVNSFAFLNRLFEWVVLPARIKKDILSLFKDLQGKTVLEFGSGVGSLTMPLAEAVGDKGKIYAVDLSKKNIRILNKRLERRGHKHVTAVHDEHFISRVHPDVPFVDFVFSVGNLSYIQDVERVLKDMHSLLPENGRICLVEYVDYFWGVLPNQPWLDNLEELEKTFRKIGFSIRIKKKRGFFWRYLYIYGIKSEHDVPVI